MNGMRCSLGIRDSTNFSRPIFLDMGERRCRGQGDSVPIASKTSSDAAAGALDIAEFIDAQPVGRFQLKVLLLCAAVLFFAGFAPQPIAYVSPPLPPDS